MFIVHWEFWNVACNRTVVCVDFDINFNFNLRALLDKFINEKPREKQIETKCHVTSHFNGQKQVTQNVSANKIMTTLIKTNQEYLITK